MTAEVKPRVVIHIFHRDLRIVDNYSFNQAYAKAIETKADLIPLFIFTPEQVGDSNQYKSTNAIEFMYNSLDDLNATLGGHLATLYMEQLEALVLLQQKYNIMAISEQKDYTPYALAREKTTRIFCALHEILYLSAEDLYLTVPGSVTNKAGRMFQKFTPFYDSAKTQHVPFPTKAPTLTRLHSKLAIKTSAPKRPTSNPDLHVKGGRKEALALLEKLPADYTQTHDIPSTSSSNLSAHNHFGTISIRELYHKSKNTEFRRQLYWRDFYGHICYFFEDLYHVSPYDFQATPQPGWSTDKATFKKWTDGKTGHKLVDAAMNQLKKSGYIHNRPRLVAAIYLTKHLKIHWRWGEKWFAQHLVDYDFAQNFGNWCWVASVLPFSMAPFRSLDPEIQLKKFDPDQIYIKKWL